MPQPLPAGSLRPSPLRTARRTLVLAVAGLALTAASASADGTTGATGPSGGAEAGTTAPTGTTISVPPLPLSRAMIREVQRKLHVSQDGHLGPKTRTAIRRFQKRHALPVDGRLQPATIAALNVTGRAASIFPSVPPPTGATAELLTAIADCESGGDPTRVSKTGVYRGKYQFDVDTWAAVGGTGDPATASAAEQDQRAASLYAAKGVDPWPVCGPQAQGAQQDS